MHKTYFTLCLLENVVKAWDIMTKDYTAMAIFFRWEISLLIAIYCIDKKLHYSRKLSYLL